MFIRSNIITRDHILDALAHARRQGWGIHLDDDGIREFRPRTYRRGFQFYCESFNGRRARNGRPGYAASWDAYGVAFARLFEIDPDAEIADYKGVEDFIESTRRAAEHGQAHGYTAPWLNA